MLTFILGGVVTYVLTNPEKFDKKAIMKKVAKYFVNK